MKIASAQINSVIGDFEGNRQKIKTFWKKAKKKGADLVVFPELALCGYPPMDLLDHQSFVDKNKESLRWLQRELSDGPAVVVGHVEGTPQLGGKALQNSVSLLQGGEILFRQAKTLLPTYDVFDEARYFEPAADRRCFLFAGEKLGFALCEDIWWESVWEEGTRYGVDPVQELLDQGATVILAPSASPFYAGKFRIRQDLTERIGRIGGVSVLYVNMTGANDSLIFDGQSMAVSRKGSLVHRGKAFEEDFFVYDTQSEEVSEGPRRKELSLYEELECALVTGIRDYLAKCGFSRVHLGLSGGIDSALVAVLAAKALGPNKVAAFAMPSMYSSQGSLTDAEALAGNLGIAYSVIPITPLYEAFETSLAPHFEGSPPNVAEENIQARIRGTLLMGYSNKWGSLVLTTGNKSELATGYCTLYGDMAGGLAVIGDLLKTEVFGLCRYINREEEIIPESILTKPPSAELRPDQKDEDSLPPYDVLDAILVKYLIESKTGEQIIKEGLPPEAVHQILSLVGRTEYKRRQAPPVLKVSPRAFGTGRRMPVARKIYEA